MAVQTSVAADLTPLVAGMVERTTKTPVILSRVVDEANGIPRGVYMVRDGSDRKVDLPVSQTEVQTGMGGFAVGDFTRVYDSAGFANGEDVGMLVEGVIAVVTEEAVTQGEAVFVRHTASGGNTQLGACRNDWDAGTCAKLPGAFFLETTTAAGTARVYKTSAFAEAQYQYVTVKITDVSTADAVEVASPVNGKVVGVRSVLGAAISGADSAIVTKIAGVAITNGGFTVAQSGSAAGDVDSATPTAANTVTAGQVLSVETDGASTGTAELVVTFTIQVA